MDLQLEQFDQDNVELVPDTMELLTDTELTQYYIQTWSLDYNDPGERGGGSDPMWNFPHFFFLFDGFPKVSKKVY